jgi:hypothetical protein
VFIDIIGLRLGKIKARNHPIASRLAKPATTL